MFCIFKKEMNYYFHTAIGYIYVGIFLLFCAFFYNIINLSNLSSDLATFIAQLSIVNLFLIPLLTMNMFCKEFAQATHKLLFSAPISTASIVFGKFLSCLCVLGICYGFSLIYIVITYLYGFVFWGEVLLASLGFLLHFCLILSFNLYIASWQKKQMSAAIIALLCNIGIYLLQFLPSALLGKIYPVLQFINPYERLNTFMIGQLSFANMLYFILLSLVFLFATWLHLNKLMFGGSYEKK